MRSRGFFRFEAPQTLRDADPGVPEADLGSENTGFALAHPPAVMEKRPYFEARARDPVDLPPGSGLVVGGVGPIRGESRRGLRPPLYHRHGSESVSQQDSLAVIAESTTPTTKTTVFRLFFPSLHVSASYVLRSERSQWRDADAVVAGRKEEGDRRGGWVQRNCWRRRDRGAPTPSLVRAETSSGRPAVPSAAATTRAAPAPSRARAPRVGRVVRPGPEHTSCVTFVGGSVGCLKAKDDGKARSPIKYS